MVTYFLYGVIFATSVALIFIAGGNPSSSSNPKVDYDDPIIRPPHPHPMVDPSYPASLGATTDINEDTRGQGGVGHALLRTLPTFAYTKRRRARIGKGIGVCVICQSELRDAQMVRWLPNCDHLFHRVCIDRWLASHSTCPCCRAHLHSPFRNDDDAQWRLPLAMMHMSMSFLSNNFLLGCDFSWTSPCILFFLVYCVWVWKWSLSHIDKIEDFEHVYKLVSYSVYWQLVLD